MLKISQDFQGYNDSPHYKLGYLLAALKQTKINLGLIKEKTDPNDYNINYLINDSLRTVNDAINIDKPTFTPEGQ